MNIPRSSPPNRTILIKFTNYEGIAVIELQFYHFPDSDRLRVGSVVDQIVWMTEYGDQSTTRE